MTRDPDASEEPQYEGGRAAERLREFLEARFGDEAPPVPPDEEQPEEQEEEQDGPVLSDGEEQPEEQGPAEPREDEPGS